MLLSWQHSDADGDGHRQHFGGKNGAILLPGANIWEEQMDPSAQCVENGRILHGAGYCTIFHFTIGAI